VIAVRHTVGLAMLAIVVVACASAPTERGDVAASTIVAIQLAGTSTFVSVQVNARNEDALFLLDTGSSLTVLAPLYANRIGITVPNDAPRRQLTGIGGHNVSVPLVTVARLAVGTAVVQNFTVGVYDAIPEATTVDGILGLDFLKRYRCTVDTGAKRLRLEPVTTR
jgi:predicted aspartyl protease